MNRTVETLNRLLPQTQCRECGFSGCLPYAEALAAGQAEVNLCAPGGEVVMADIAAVLQRPPKTPVRSTVPALAWIDEAVCIGCTACIRACPVDAILGASKYMHTVLSAECTGCALCVAPCPVDCIHMQPVKSDYLPQARWLAAPDLAERFAAAAHAQSRYQRRQQRLQTQQEMRRRRQVEREAAVKAKQQVNGTPPNTAALIAQAMARAQAQQHERKTADNREAYRAEQIRQAQERATYRRYLRDAQYGNEAEKAAAIAWLQQYKAEQEAKQQASSVA